MKIEIIPSILIQTKKEFLTQSAAVSECLNMVQLDIADGKFVPNTTWEPDPETVADNLEIDCELHLMIENPLEEVRRWEHVDQVKRILVHYESTKNIGQTIGAVHSYGWDVGLVLNPETPIEVVNEHIEELDAVMLMGVKPGAQGQKFIPETLDRIKQLRVKYPNLFISVDGAVNEETIEDIIEAGATGVCPGSAIFGNDRTPEEHVKRMKELRRSS